MTVSGIKQKPTHPEIKERRKYIDFNILRTLNVQNRYPCLPDSRLVFLQLREPISMKV
jgi:hypothetical protein